MDIDGILTIIELILFVAGILSLLLIPVLVIAGIFLYKKNKKWLCAIPAILILFLAFSFYYSLPLYFIYYNSIEKFRENENLSKFVTSIAISQEHAAGLEAINAFYYDSTLEYTGIINKTEQKEFLDKIIHYNSSACFTYDKHVDVNACDRLVYTYAMLTRYDEAIYTYESLNRRLSELRHNYKPNYDLIELYILNKDYAGALKALELYDFRIKDTKIIYKAETYRRMGKPQEALKILNDYINSNPKNYFFRAIGFRALAHMDLGQIKQAKQDYEKAKEYSRHFNSCKTFEEFIEEAKIEHSYDEMRKRKGIVLEN